jgi:antitoxin ParD1/3/4
MESITISLPERMKEFVEAEVSEGQFGTASEYICKLIRREQIKKTRVTIDKSLLEALDSEFSPMTTADWKHIRQEVARRIVEQSSQ